MDDDADTVSCAVPNNDSETPRAMTTECKICKHTAKVNQHIVVRHKYNASLYKCDVCGFVFFEDPEWLAEAYAEPIQQSDTGYIARNLWARDHVIRVLEKNEFNPEHQFLDYGAGYGMFVRLRRDCGYNFLWFDKYCGNLFSRGFEAPCALQGKYAAVTAFEVLEHMVDPLPEIEAICASTEVFICSTQLIPRMTPRAEDWWYYGFAEHGQHVSFYSEDTLGFIAKRLGMRLYLWDRIHVLSKRELLYPETKSTGILGKVFARLSKAKSDHGVTRKPLTEIDRVAVARRATGNR
jgi:hypothetical protein